MKTRRRNLPCLALPGLTGAGCTFDAAIFRPSPRLLNDGAAPFARARAMPAQPVLRRAPAAAIPLRFLLRVECLAAPAARPCPPKAIAGHTGRRPALRAAMNRPRVPFRRYRRAAMNAGRAVALGIQPGLLFQHAIARPRAFQRAIDGVNPPVGRHLVAAVRACRAGKVFEPHSPSATIASHAACSASALRECQRVRHCPVQNSRFSSGNRPPHCRHRVRSMS